MAVHIPRHLHTQDTVSVLTPDDSRSLLDEQLLALDVLEVPHRLSHLPHFLNPLRGREGRLDQLLSLSGLALPELRDL